MDEYISKHEPIEEIKRIYCTSCNSYNGAMCRACEHQDDIDIIEDTKAADVQPVHCGEWENEYLEDDVWWAECTNCKNETHSRFGRVSSYAFCPNCGARMEQEG